MVDRVDIVGWGRDEFLRRLDDVMRIYRDAFHVDEAEVAAQREITTRHASYPGFVSTAAVTDSAEVVGFCYGTAGDESQWWHRRVAPAFPDAERRRWLSDYFGVAELAVAPTSQGRGIGRLLVESLLASPNVRNHASVVLMTDADNTPAQRLYEALGFRVVLADYRFAPSGVPKLVLARAAKAEQ